MNLANELIEQLQPLGILTGLPLAQLRTYFAAHTASATFAGQGRPVVSLQEAGSLVSQLAEHESLLLLSAPGVGKTDIVNAAARRAGLRCYSLLGTQLAPEDLTGLPRIEGNRTVFYPPRVVLPEDGRPFCLFLDELPAASADVQKAMYSLLLERRLGEHVLPPGSWVVAAGNRADDAAFVRPLSSALVNRLFIVHVQPTLTEWLVWAERAQVRTDIRVYLRANPEALLRNPREDDGPFSTPRAWASLSSALDRVAAAGRLDDDTRRALAHGRVSPEDADRYCEMADGYVEYVSPELYLENPNRVPRDRAGRLRALAVIREALANHRACASSEGAVRFLNALDPEERSFMMSGLVREWLGLVGPTLLRNMLIEWLNEVTSDYEYTELS